MRHHKRRSIYHTYTIKWCVWTHLKMTSQFSRHKLYASTTSNNKRQVGFSLKFLIQLSIGAIIVLLYVYNLKLIIFLLIEILHILVCFLLILPSTSLYLIHRTFSLIKQIIAYLELYQIISQLNCLKYPFDVLY